MLVLYVTYSELLQVLCSNTSLSNQTNNLVSAQQLTLTSQPQTSGTYCPGPVTFTCVGTQINALIWNVNGSRVATYIFQENDEFPYALPLDFPLDGVMAIITNAINSSAAFDITSLLNVNDVSVLNGTSLQCKSSLNDGETFQIQVITPSKV